MSLPNPISAEMQLRNAISTNKRPQELLYEFLRSDSMESTVFANTLRNYKNLVLILSSPQGRVYLHRWLDDTLNYLQKYVELV